MNNPYRPAPTSTRGYLSASIRTNALKPLQTPAPGPCFRLLWCFWLVSVCCGPCFLFQMSSPPSLIDARHPAFTVRQTSFSNRFLFRYTEKLRDDKYVSMMACIHQLFCIYLLLPCLAASCSVLAIAFFLFVTDYLFLLLLPLVLVLLVPQSSHA